MPVLLKTLSLFVACLIASVADAQDTNGTIRPAASTLVAKIDSIVQVDVLAQGMPSVSVVVTRGNETLVERSSGTERTLRKIGVRPLDPVSRGLTPTLTPY